MSSCDGGESYIRLIGDLDMMQNMCKYVEVWEDGDKIRCIDDMWSKLGYRELVGHGNDGDSDYCANMFVEQ